MPSATIQPHLERNGSRVDAGSNDGVAIVRDMRSLRLEGLQRCGLCPQLANLVNKFLRVLDRPTNTGKTIKTDGGLRFRVRRCRERLAHHLDPTSRMFDARTGICANQNMREPEWRDGSYENYEEVDNSDGLIRP